MCNHLQNKQLTDEFRPELDRLKGYKLVSPKELMMEKLANRTSFQESGKM